MLVDEFKMVRQRLQQLKDYFIQIKLGINDWDITQALIEDLEYIIRLSKLSGKEQKL